MDEEVKILKEEVMLLKQKLKKKSEKLKKAKERINGLIPKSQRTSAFYHARNTEMNILRDLISNLDEFTYEVKFKYGNKIYEEPMVKSFGSKWLKQSLVCHFAREKQIIIDTFDIVIISAKKLW